MLYIYTTKNRTPENKLRDRVMSGLAVDAGIQVMEEQDGGVLDSMSNSRPHNVCHSGYKNQHFYSDTITSPLILRLVANS